MDSDPSCTPMPTIHLLRQEAEVELHKILHWWQLRMTDPENGGFYGRIDGAGKLHPHAEKGLILNARILWTFSAAARMTGDPAYLQTAKRAFRYLTDHFWDELNGGVYWSVDYTGAPFQTKKQVYAQAFAIYALSEYYLCTQEAESLRLATEIFHVLENHAIDPIQNGYMEAFAENWVLLEDLRLSDKDANEAKTQNTHLHVLEAYTKLYQVNPAEPIQKALRNLISLFLDHFIDPKTHHIHLFFDENWKLKSDIISFGHDIEASWLLWEAAKALNDPALLKQLKPVCLHIAEKTLQEAIDQEGAVINERHVGQNRLDTDRIWWVQAEALVGFWNAWQLSGQDPYQEAVVRIWEFIQQQQRDVVDGEWFWGVTAAGIPNLKEDKAGFWKCPYHNGRAMMEIISRMGSC